MLNGSLLAYWSADWSSEFINPYTLPYCQADLKKYTPGGFWGQDTWRLRFLCDDEEKEGEEEGLFIEVRARF